jgi:hypothetical protein
MVLLMVEGLHVPTIPLGEVVFSVGAVSPLHKVKEVAKFGVIGLVIVMETVSVMERPQLFMAVNVTIIVPLAFEGIVKEVANELTLVKLPVEADQVRV